jgi:hypothetical protein
MKTFLTQICLTKNGVYSSYMQKGQRAVQTAGVMFLAAVALAAPLSSAQAGICMHPSKPDWKGWGTVGCSSDPRRECYPARLHGTWIYLFTGRSSARAFAEAWLNPGDILSIDRSRAEFKGNDWDHKWPWTHQVAAAGGWDYCERRAPLYNFWRTPQVDGYKHAVRVCLRRNGDLRCTNTWYSDQDR